jgi:acyl-coenzyme A thioesterase PaaI-like protein
MALKRADFGGSVNSMSKSLQEKYAAKSACFGCGPANQKGLRIRSMEPAEGGDVVTAEWKPSVEHEAFPGMLNGGIIGSLLDCHSNWTAAWHLMKKAGLDQPPCTVTADYAIKLLRPTPTQGPVHLEAKVVESRDDRATIEATLTAGGKVCATCRGTFVAVKEGHPAYHRW